MAETIPNKGTAQDILATVRQRLLDAEAELASLRAHALSAVEDCETVLQAAKDDLGSAVFDLDDAEQDAELVFLCGRLEEKVESERGSLVHARSVTECAIEDAGAVLAAAADAIDKAM